ncbi:MAG: BACON domain-containing carbohydrate-binding protein [Candidatus Doudnabacteria bacterium]
MKKFVLILMVLVGLSLSVNQVGAFSLSPASLELEVKRGESKTQIFNVNNDSEKPILCQIAVTGFEVLSDGKQRFEDATPDYSAASWIKAKSAEFDIPAKSSGKAEVIIAVPKTAKPGDYFACIFAQTQAPSKAKTSQGQEIVIAVNFRLGCIVRITVPGRTISKKAEVGEVKVEMPSAENKEEGIKIIATLANKCALHLDARGEVLIKNSKNRIFDKFVLQGAGKNAKGEALVYPMGSREFSGTVQRPLPAGEEYTAEIAFAYGYRSQKAKSEAKFTVSQEVGDKQKEFLTLTAEPNPIEAQMLSGSFRARSVEIFNLDFEPLVVKAISQVPWIVVEPAEFTIRSGREKSLRIMISVPANEPVARVGKIVLTPERGKPVVVDIVVSETKKEKKEK